MMHKDCERIMLTEEQLRSRVKEIAEQVGSEEHTSELQSH